MEEIGCDKGLDVVIFSTCITVASSIDEVCAVFVIGDEYNNEITWKQQTILTVSFFKESFVFDFLMTLSRFKNT